MSDLTQDLKAALGQAGVSSALLVDDAFDAAPRAADLKMDRADWDVFFDDIKEGDEDEIRAEYPDYDPDDIDAMLDSDDFVEVVWRLAQEDRLDSSLTESVFQRYRLDTSQDLKYLAELESRLDALGITCTKAGRDFREKAAAPPLIFIDLYLGSSQVASDTSVSIEGLAKVVEERRDSPPIVVLMSRSVHLEEMRSDFRNKSGLLESMFRIMHKDDIEAGGRLERILFRLVRHFEAARTWGTFLRTWLEGAHRACLETVDLMRRLDLGDLARLEKLLLDTEGQPIGHYLIDVFDLVLRHEVEGDSGIVDVAHSLSELTAGMRPLSSIAGTRDLQGIVFRSLFAHPERARLSSPGSSPVAFGDVLRRRVGGEPPSDEQTRASDKELTEVGDEHLEVESNVHLAPGTEGGSRAAGAESEVPSEEEPRSSAVRKELDPEGSLETLRGLAPNEVLVSLTPACDLQRRGQGAHRILFMNGKLKPFSSPKDWSYKAGPPRTPILEIGEERTWIEWNTKKLQTETHDVVQQVLESGNGAEVVGRLRESHALELQQRLLSNLGRVGLLSKLPGEFPVDVLVYYVNTQLHLIRVPAPVLDELGGICVAGRIKDDPAHELVLSEDACESLVDGLRKVDRDELFPTSRPAFESALADGHLFKVLEDGLRLPQSKGLAPASTANGASLSAWLGRHAELAEQPLPKQSAKKACIVLLAVDKPSE